MKKLMIAAAIVCAAAFAQAASFKWTTGGLTAPNADGTWGSTPAAEATGTWLATVTLYDAEGNVLTGVTGTSSSTVNTMTSAIQNTFDGYSFVFDNETVYKGVLTMTYTSAAGVQTITTDAISMPLKKTGTTTMNFSDKLAAATWSAVPEPTSGLLLLLGVAGLALRRRRA